MFVYYSITLILNLFLKKYFSLIGIKHSKPYVNIVFYIIWTILGFKFMYNLSYDYTDSMFLYRDVMIHSLNCKYLYELIFEKLDLAHTIHHLICILLQQFTLFCNFAETHRHIQLCATGYCSIYSSIFSNGRHIVDNHKWLNKYYMQMVYYYSYLIGKISSICLFYWIIYQYNIDYYSYPNFIVIFFYLMLHLIQLYFAYKIICKLY